MLSKGELYVKKDILVGVFSPLFYCIVVNIMLYTILAGEYNEKYAITSIAYLSSCLIGSVVAGVITFVKKRKSNRTIEKTDPLDTAK